MIEIFRRNIFNIRNKILTCTFSSNWKPFFIACPWENYQRKGPTVSIIVLTCHCVTAHEQKRLFTSSFCRRTTIFWLNCRANTEIRGRIFKFEVMQKTPFLINTVRLSLSFASFRPINEYKLNPLSKQAYRYISIDLFLL